MRALLLAAVCTLTLCAFEAQAQAATGYDCRGFGGGKSCVGGIPPAKDSRPQVRQANRERPAPPKTARPLLQSGPGDPATPDWRRRLGDAILEGRCEDARRIALAYGSLDMALKAQRLCRPGPWLPLS